jgi:hypothetical protein
MTDRPLENLILNPPAWRKNNNAWAAFGPHLFGQILDARRLTAKCNSAKDAWEDAASVPRLGGHRP